MTRISAQTLAGDLRLAHFPAPLRGLNSRDPLDGMDPGYAVQLFNYFPGAGELTLRPGNRVKSNTTGLGLTQKRSGGLFSYAASNGGVGKLFAAIDTHLYDTAGGTMSSVRTIGDASGRGITFTNPVGSTYFWWADGVAAPSMYDGTTWSAPAVTGVTTTSIVNPWISHHRIWFIEANTANAYFLPLDSIQGAASKYPMGSLLTRGGWLVDGIGWTIDGGQGADDFMAICSSEGEVLIFTGTDPSSSTSWALQGVFYIGRPASNRPFVVVGGDIYYLSKQGLFPLSKALISAAVNNALALTNKIEPTLVGCNAWAQAVTAGALDGSVNGTSVCLFPEKNALLINVAFQTNFLGSYTTYSVQFVMNTTTGAWTIFTGWDSHHLATWQGKLYGLMQDSNADPCVVQLWDDTTTVDNIKGPYETNVLPVNGNYRVGLIQTAYSQLGLSAMKKMEEFRAIIQYDHNFNTRWAYGSNFDLKPGILYASGLPTRQCTETGGSATNLGRRLHSYASGPMTNFSLWHCVQTNDATLLKTTGFDLYYRQAGLF